MSNPEWKDEIFLIDRDGSNERRIGHGRWPDWSPDGSEIVFSIGGEQTGGARIGSVICIAKADGSDRREIIEGDSPSWSPDGKKIAFCFSAPQQPPLIRVHDLRTNRQETLGFGWFRANWLPDSKSVVANGWIDRKRVMVRLSVDRLAPPAELSTVYDDPQSPCCTWDGKEIVYIAKRPNQEPR